jgi:hypothetical protein
VTTSAIRFHEQVIFVRDPELRALLKAVAYHLSDYARQNAAVAAWLVEACAGWVDDHEGSAPGLRDLELDAALATAERVAEFVGYLGWLERLAPPDHVYDAQAARRVIARVLTELGARL